MERSCDSSPQSLTTTQEQLTTLRGLPSRSIWPAKIISHTPKQRTDSKIKRTETSPLAELLAIGDLDERDLVLRAEGNDKLLVGLLLASLVQDAHVRLATVEGLGSLTETAGKTVVDEGDLEYSWDILDCFIGHCSEVTNLSTRPVLTFHQNRRRCLLILRPHQQRRQGR